MIIFYYLNAPSTSEPSNKPTPERLAQMLELRAELEKRQPKETSGGAEETAPAAEYEKAGTKGNIEGNQKETGVENVSKVGTAPINKTILYNNVPSTEAPSAAGTGAKPLGTCARCPLYEAPYVGGRGGALTNPPKRAIII